MVAVVVDVVGMEEVVDVAAVAVAVAAAGGGEVVVVVAMVEVVTRATGDAVVGIGGSLLRSSLAISALLTSASPAR